MKKLLSSTFVVLTLGTSFAFGWQTIPQNVSGQTAINIIKAFAQAGTSTELVQGTGQQWLQIHLLNLNCAVTGGMPTCSYTHHTLRNGDVPRVATGIAASWIIEALPKSYFGQAKFNYSWLFCSQNDAVNMVVCHMEPASSETSFGTQPYSTDSTEIMHELDPASSGVLNEIQLESVKTLREIESIPALGG